MACYKLQSLRSCRAKEKTRRRYVYIYTLNEKVIPKVKGAIRRFTIIILTRCWVSDERKLVGEEKEKKNIYGKKSNIIRKTRVQDRDK